MKPKRINAVQVCKEFEDVLAPRRKLSVLDRAVYSHLLRHSFLEGKLRLRFSIVWLANNLGITSRRARQSVRRLVDAHKRASLQCQSHIDPFCSRSPDHSGFLQGNMTTTGILAFPVMAAIHINLLP